MPGELAVTGRTPAGISHGVAPSRPYYCMYTPLQVASWPVPTAGTSLQHTLCRTSPNFPVIFKRTLGTGTNRTHRKRERETLYQIRYIALPLHHNPVAITPHPPCIQSQLLLHTSIAPYPQACHSLQRYCTYSATVGPPSTLCHARREPVTIAGSVCTEPHIAMVYWSTPCCLTCHMTRCRQHNLHMCSASLLPTPTP